MNVNKRHFVFAAAALAAFFTVTGSQAVEEAASAPAMTGVQEVVVQYLRLGNSKVSEICGVTRGEMEKLFLDVLKGYGVPAVTSVQAGMPKLNVARIELLPEIATVSTQGVECTSWLSLTAQTQNTLRIPPIDVPRNVSVTYWRSGVLVSSNVTAHPKVIAEAYEKLARQFGQQYKVDQPPPLPKLDGK